MDGRKFEIDVDLNAFQKNNTLTTVEYVTESSTMVNIAIKSSIYEEKMVWSHVKPNFMRSYVQVQLKSHFHFDHSEDSREFNKDWMRFSEIA